MEVSLQHYRSEHQNPANRILHIIGMPFILLSFVMFLRIFYLASYFTAADFVSLLYLRNYYEYDPSTLVPMGSFFLSLNYIANRLQTHPFFILYSILFHFIVWTFQLIGHADFEE